MEFNLNESNILWQFLKLFSSIIWWIPYNPGALFFFEHDKETVGKQAKESIKREKKRGAKKPPWVETLTHVFK